MALARSMIDASCHLSISREIAMHTHPTLKALPLASVRIKQRTCKCSSLSHTTANYRHHLTRYRIAVRLIINGHDHNVHTIG